MSAQTSLQDFYYKLSSPIFTTTFSQQYKLPTTSSSKLNELIKELSLLQHNVGNRSSLIYSALLPTNTLNEYKFYNVTNISYKITEHDKHIPQYKSIEPITILTNFLETSRTNLLDTLIQYTPSSFHHSTQKKYDVIDLSSPSPEYMNIQFQFLNQTTQKPILELQRVAIKHLKQTGTLVLPIYYLDYQTITTLSKKFTDLTILSPITSQGLNYYTLYLYNYTPNRTTKFPLISSSQFRSLHTQFLKHKIQFYEAILTSTYNEYNREILDLNKQLFEELNIQIVLKNGEPLNSNSNTQKVLKSFFSSSPPKFITPIHENAKRIGTTNTLLSIASGYGAVEHLLIHNRKIKNLIIIDQRNDIEFNKFPNKYLKPPRTIKVQILSKGDEFELKNLLTNTNIPKPTKIYINTNWKSSQTAQELLNSFNVPIIFGQS